MMMVMLVTMMMIILVVDITDVDVVMFIISSSSPSPKLYDLQTPLDHSQLCLGPNAWTDTAWRRAGRENVREMPV